jgi:hypothetical protein
MEANNKHRFGTIDVVVLAIVFVITPSRGYSQDLVKVDGVASQCVVNQPRQVQHPGPGTLFPSPQYGYCNGSIQHNCATSRQPFGPSSSAYETIPTACVGTFSSWTDIQAQQAKSIADLQQQFQQQLNILKANIQALSDANDALTKRLNDVEAKLKNQGTPK